jgi:hypothetical protein
MKRNVMLRQRAFAQSSPNAASDLQRSASVFAAVTAPAPSVERRRFDPIGFVTLILTATDQVQDARVRDGIGDDHYPLPWESLKYDTNLGGYVTGITDSQLRGAPKYSNESSWNWSDPTVARSVDDFYRGVPTP